MGMSPRPVPLLACPAVLSASGAIWVFMHVVDGGQRGLGGRQIAGVVGVFVRTNLTCRARLDEVSGWHPADRALACGACVALGAPSALFDELKPFEKEPSTAIFVSFSGRDEQFGLEVVLVKSAVQ